ncbi:hypothetical protein LSH36_175g00004, partial [Paralvinella palmiformis]
ISHNIDARSKSAGIFSHVVIPRDMRKILSALCLFLFYAERKLGVSCSRFGHEPGAYNVPNLIPLESSEMTYIPTSNQNSPNRWAEIRDNLFYRASYDLFEPGYTYMFNVFIKLTSSANDLVMTSAQARSWYTKEPGKDKRDYSYVDFFVKVDNQTDFIIDAASLTKVDYPDWKKEAQENIKGHRMGNIMFSFRTSRGLDPDKLRVEVTQKRRHFPFGFAVNAEVIGGDDGDEYVQRYVLRWFLLVPYIEHGLRNVPPGLCSSMPLSGSQWSPMDAILLAKMQLHLSPTLCKHWVTYKYMYFEKDAHRQAQTRNKYTQRQTKPLMANVCHFRFQHWDVCNEFSVSRLYQNWLKREDVLEYLYSDVRKFDPNVKRFTNEWGNLQIRIHFSDTVNAILRLKESQLIDGIGLQAHFHPKENKLDMELIKRRLEIFTGLGIPVWITELTIKHSNPTIRGNLLADSLTLFYGTPGVQGMLLWDFAPNNAAGDKYDEILTGWSTNLVLRPSSGKSQISKEAFYGM